MLDKFEQELRKRLADRWYCPTPVGLNLDEIKSATAFWPHALPGVYERFLSVCGQDAGDLFFEYIWRAADLKSMNERLVEYAQESAVSLPNDVFAFLNYIGDYCWCFGAGEPDPKVLMFDHFEIAPTAYRLSEFLLRWEQFETPRA